VAVKMREMKRENLTSNFQEENERNPREEGRGEKHR